MNNSPRVVVAGTRQVWSSEQKRAILAEADDPGTTASEVARWHGLHSSLLFRWRRVVLAEHRTSAAAAPSNYIPLALPPPATATADVPAGSGLVEIELAGGHRVQANRGGPDAPQGAIAALLGR